MEIYLPIAGLSVNIIGVLILGVVTGILSGMFGVGGGFLTTPLLIFIGIPPAVAVASSANQIVASSLSGFMAHWRRGNVDFHMGILLLEGGLVGSSLGVWLFKVLKSSGQIDLAISLLYVLLLGGIGTLMALESYRSLKQEKEQEQQQVIPAAVRRFTWLSRLPMMTEFTRSKLTISALLPLSIGCISGMLVSLLGVGGGFFMIPAMIYVLGMPTSVVIGTSLFQIIFITANVTFLQAVTTHTVDIILAVLLLSGSVFGAQLGTSIGGRISPVRLRAMLAALVLIIALRLAYDLFATPNELFTIITGNP